MAGKEEGAGIEVEEVYKKTIEFWKSTAPLVSKSELKEVLYDLKTFKFTEDEAKDQSTLISTIGICLKYCNKNDRFKFVFWERKGVEILFDLAEKLMQKDFKDNLVMIMAIRDLILSLISQPAMKLMIINTSKPNPNQDQEEDQEEEEEEEEEEIDLTVEVKSLGIKALKELAQKLSVDITGAVEKQDIVEKVTNAINSRILQTQTQNPQNPQNQNPQNEAETSEDLYGQEAWDHIITKCKYFQSKFKELEQQQQ